MGKVDLMSIAMMIRKRLILVMLSSIYVFLCFGRLAFAPAVALKNEGPCSYKLHVFFSFSETVYSNSFMSSYLFPYEFTNYKLNIDIKYD